MEVQKAPHAKKLPDVLRKGSYAVLLLFCLSLFAGVVRHVAKGGDKLGPLTRPVELFSSFPSLVKSSISELLTPPSTFQETREGFESINELKRDLRVLYSISTGDRERKIVLKNLRDGAEIASWIPQRSFRPNDRLLHPLLLEGKDVVVTVPDGEVMRIDSSGAIKWQSDPGLGGHHSINIDADQNLWIPGVRLHEDGTPLINRKFSLATERDTAEIPYRDDLIVQWDAESGEVLYTRSLTDLFAEHGLLFQLYRTAYPHDPFHLNDIEPALTTTDYFERGDLFLSLRHLSMIVHYRPASDEIVNIIEGPFSLPHDVDIVSDHRLTIVNNRSIPNRNSGFAYEVNDEAQGVVDVHHSNVLLYDLETGSFETIAERHFIEQGIFTHTEGLSEILEDGSLFFEQQNDGILWVLNEDAILYKDVIPSHIAGYHHLLNWTRIIK